MSRAPVVGAVRHRRSLLWIGACLATLLSSTGGRATSDPAAPPGEDSCLVAIARAERERGIPTHLLRSIAFVESGRADPLTGRAVPWPWTINAEGRGQYFATKEEAVAAVRALQARGVRSVDVGCAQVNLQYHPRAFDSLEAAFDPAANAAYAARFLAALYAGARNWPMAAANYHSQGSDRGLVYGRRVMAVWPGAARYGALPAPRGDAPAVSDYSRYTPVFAAAMRRLDQDRMRGPRPAADDTSMWVRRPPAPVPLSDLRRAGRTEAGQARADLRRARG